MGKTENISKSIVRYVARTLETVIWNDNGHTGIFVKDPYITQSDVKSIACIPLQFYGVSIGVLYLENDLMTGVFSEERLGIIKMLAEWMIHTKTFQEFMEEVV